MPHHASSTTRIIAPSPITRTRLIVGDGRTHLMLGTETYDVIVSEPSNPWMAGIASLFTREFFEGARARLAPGGVLCQWAHTYDISNADLRSIVATFLSVFPDGTMWLVGDADVLLVGSTEPLDARIDGIAAAMRRPGVAADLATVGVKGPFSVASLFVSHGDALKAWADGAPLQTDDRSALEFSGPRSIFGAARDDNAAALRELAAASPKPAAVSKAIASATPEDLTRPRPDAVQGGRVSAGLRRPRAGPRVESTRRGSARWTGSGRGVVEQDLRGAIPVVETGRRLRRTRQHSWRCRGFWHPRATSRRPSGSPSTSCRPTPPTSPALEQLASILSDIGDAGRLEPVVQRLVKEAPKGTWSHYYAASLFFMQDRLETALQAARNAVAIDPANAKAHNLIGACLASLGQVDAARTAFETSLKADPREPGTYANLATLELQAGNRDRALQVLHRSADDRSPQPGCS